MKNPKFMEISILEYELYLIREEKSTATIQKYLRDIKYFKRYANGSAIEKTLVLAYKSDLIKKYAVSSANSMLAALNSFLRFLGLFDCCVKQFKVQKQTYLPESKELSKEEYVRLVTTAKTKGNDRLALLLETICATGIRVSELEYITVEAVKCGEANVNCKVKMRIVFIPTKLQKLLLRYVEEQEIQSGAVFITRTGQAMNRSNIWRELKMLCMLAGVSPEKGFPHNLRHLFARTFYKNEKDVAKLADVLGHSNINTTRIYIMTTSMEHRQKIEKLGLVI